MPRDFMTRFVNPLVRTLLRAPVLHRRLSRSVMLVGYRGRRSGKSYLTPVSYFAMDRTLSVMSSRDRLWWRNLRGVPEVSLVLRGRRVKARPRVLEDRAEAASALAAHIRHTPWIAKYLEVGHDAAGGLNPADLARLAETRLVILFDLQP